MAKESVLYRYEKSSFIEDIPLEDFHDKILGKKAGEEAEYVIFDSE